MQLLEEVYSTKKKKKINFLGLYLTKKIKIEIFN